jgi:hypothetical protein
MRTPDENKSLTFAEGRRSALADAMAGYQTGKACPLCGATGKHCRPVDQGYFCQQDGLIPDESNYITPRPDPIGEAVRNDPAVVKATRDRDSAVQQFQRCDVAWQNAVAAAAQARIVITAGSNPINRAEDGYSRPSRDSIREAVRRAPGLEERVEAAFEEREEAARAQLRASVTLTDAMGDAEERLGRPRHAPRSCPPEDAVRVAGQWV